MSGAILREKPLWPCPRCGRLFANRNQTHACGRHELSALFAGRDPAIFALFQSLEKLVRRVGPVTVVPEKTRIAFQVRRSFMAVSPRQMHLIGHFVFARRVPHPRFQKIDTMSARNVVHHFCLERPDELDAQFEEWIREAYAVGCQEHFEKDS